MRSLRVYSAAVERLTADQQVPGSNPGAPFSTGNLVYHQHIHARFSNRIVSATEIHHWFSHQTLQPAPSPIVEESDLGSPSEDGAHNFSAFPMRPATVDPHAMPRKARKPLIPTVTTGTSYSSTASSTVRAQDSVEELRPQTSPAKPGFSQSRTQRTRGIFPTDNKESRGGGGLHPVSAQQVDSAEAERHAEWLRQSRAYKARSEAARSEARSAADLYNTNFAGGAQRPERPATHDPALDSKRRSSSTSSPTVVREPAFPTWSTLPHPTSTSKPHAASKNGAANSAAPGAASTSSTSERARAEKLAEKLAEKMGEESNGSIPRKRAQRKSAEKECEHSSSPQKKAEAKKEDTNATTSGQSHPSTGTSTGGTNPSNSASTTNAAASTNAPQGPTNGTNGTNGNGYPVISSQQIIEQEIKREVGAIKRKKNPAERRKLVLKLLAKWHPDKNPENQVFATKIFQFIQAEL